MRRPPLSRNRRHSNSPPSRPPRVQARSQLHLARKHNVIMLFSFVLCQKD